MSKKLVIIRKLTRPSVDVDFYTAPEELRNQINSSQHLASSVTYDLSPDLLTQTRVMTWIVPDTTNIQEFGFTLLSSPLFVHIKEAQLNYCREHNIQIHDPLFEVYNEQNLKTQNGTLTGLLH
jgi:hypothetical protein